MFQKLINHLQSIRKPKNPIVLEEKIVDDTISFPKVFKNQNPLVVEFGVGKGRFIRDYAVHSPNKNFFGVEKINKWVKHTVVRIQKADLRNVRMIETDANKVLAKTPPATVSEYYILFPDPWPKRRHQQRRIIQSKLMQKIHETLTDQGTLYIATDHQSYYHRMLEVIDPFLKTHFSPINDKKIEFLSNYQIKYEHEGRPIYSIYLQKNKQ